MTYKQKLDKAIRLAEKMRTKAENGDLNVEEDGIGYEYFDGKVQGLIEAKLLFANSQYDKKTSTKTP